MKERQTFSKVSFVDLTQQVVQQSADARDNSHWTLWSGNKKSENLKFGGEFSPPGFSRKLKSSDLSTYQYRPEKK